MFTSSLESKGNPIVEKLLKLTKEAPDSPAIYSEICTHHLKISNKDDIKKLILICLEQLKSLLLKTREPLPKNIKLDEIPPYTRITDEKIFNILIVLATLEKKSTPSLELSMKYEAIIKLIPTDYDELYYNENTHPSYRHTKKLFRKIFREICLYAIKHQTNLKEKLTLIINIINNLYKKDRQAIPTLYNRITKLLCSTVFELINEINFKDTKLAIAFFQLSHNHLIRLNHTRIYCAEIAAKVYGATQIAELFNLFSHSQYVFNHQNTEEEKSKHIDETIIKLITTYFEENNPKKAIEIMKDFKGNDFLLWLSSCNAHIAHKVNLMRFCYENNIKLSLETARKMLLKDSEKLNLNYENINKRDPEKLLELLKFCGHEQLVEFFIQHEPEAITSEDSISHLIIRLLQQFQLNRKSEQAKIKPEPIDFDNGSMEVSRYSADTSMVKPLNWLDLYHRNKAYKEKGTIPHYTKLAQSISNKISKLLEKHPHFKKITLIELGCGDGSTLETVVTGITNQLGRQNIHAIGCDYAQNIIHTARQKYQTKKSTTIDSTASEAVESKELKTTKADNHPEVEFHVVDVVSPNCQTFLAQQTEVVKKKIDAETIVICSGLLTVKVLKDIHDCRTALQNICRAGINYIVYGGLNRPLFSQKTLNNMGYKNIISTEDSAGVIVRWKSPHKGIDPLLACKPIDDFITNNTASTESHLNLSENAWPVETALNAFQGPAAPFKERVTSLNLSYCKISQYNAEKFQALLALFPNLTHIEFVSSYSNETRFAAILFSQMNLFKTYQCNITSCQDASKNLKNFSLWSSSHKKTTESKTDDSQQKLAQVIKVLCEEQTSEEQTRQAVDELEKLFAEGNAEAGQHLINIYRYQPSDHRQVRTEYNRNIENYILYDSDRAKEIELALESAKKLSLSFFIPQGVIA